MVNFAQNLVFWPLYPPLLHATCSMFHDSARYPHPFSNLKRKEYNRPIVNNSHSECIKERAVERFKKIINY